MANLKKPNSSKPSPENNNGYAHISGITFEILGINLLIMGGGYYLDQWIAFKIPWILIGSIFISIAATIYHLLRKYGS